MEKPREGTWFWYEDEKLSSIRADLINEAHPVQQWHDYLTGKMCLSPLGHIYERGICVFCDYSPSYWNRG